MIAFYKCELVENIINFVSFFMKIKCRKCGREMDLWEFSPYIEVYLVKLAVSSGLISIFTEAIKNYFFAKREIRGFVDGHMATFANLLGIKCPQCKELEVWDPISVVEKESDIAPHIENIEEAINKKHGDDLIR